MIIISKRVKKSMIKSKLAIIIPCYNEQEMLNLTIKRLLEVLSDLSQKEIMSISM